MLVAHRNLYANVLSVFCVAFLLSLKFSGIFYELNRIYYTLGFGSQSESILNNAPQSTLCCVSFKNVVSMQIEIEL